MGRFGEQSASTVLPTHARRTKAVADGDTRLGADRGNYRTILRREGGGFVMRSLRRFFTRFRNLSARRRNDERMQEEIEEHLARQTADNIRAGFSAEEARRRAVLKFGA